MIVETQKSSTSQEWGPASSEAKVEGIPDSPVGRKIATTGQSERTRHLREESRHTRLTQSERFSVANDEGFRPHLRRIWHVPALGKQIIARASSAHERSEDGTGKLWALASAWPASSSCQRGDISLYGRAKATILDITSLFTCESARKRLSCQKCLIKKVSPSLVGLQPKIVTL